MSFYHPKLACSVGGSQSSQGERDKLQKEKELLQAEIEKNRQERENEQRMNRLQMQQLEEKQAEVQVRIVFQVGVSFNMFNMFQQHFDNVEIL